MLEDIEFITDGGWVVTDCIKVSVRLEKVVVVL